MIDESGIIEFLTELQVEAKQVYISHSNGFCTGIILEIKRDSVKIDDARMGQVLILYDSINTISAWKGSEE